VSDTWDGGYEESLDDGHEFAERQLLLPEDPAFAEEGGRGVTWDDQRAEKLEKGLVFARFNGTCVVCCDPIEINDPITAVGVNGWRHAGCEGEQVFETQYKKDEKAANDLLDRESRRQAREF